MIVTKIKTFAKSCAIVMLAISTRLPATCECSDTTLEDRIRRASLVLIGEIHQARVETLGEYRYYRLPGKRSWLSESAVPPELRSHAEMRISRDRVIWAQFSDIRVLKGSFDSASEIRMGDSNCPMTVTMGGIYLVISLDGKTTSYCEGASELQSWDEDQISELSKLSSDAQETSPDNPGR